MWVQWGFFFFYWRYFQNCRGIIFSEKTKQICRVELMSMYVYLFGEGSPGPLGRGAGILSLLNSGSTWSLWQMLMGSTCQVGFSSSPEPRLFLNWKQTLKPPVEVPVSISQGGTLWHWLQTTWILKPSAALRFSGACPVCQAELPMEQDRGAVEKTQPYCSPEHGRSRKRETNVKTKDG